MRQTETACSGSFQLSYDQSISSKFSSHVQGFYGRDLPEDFGLQHAGEYLASHFGASYKYIWGLGLLAAGQASTMSGTYTGELLPC